MIEKLIAFYHGITILIEDVKIYGKSKQATAKAYNFKRTSLNRYLNRLDEEVSIIKTLTDDDLQQILRRNAFHYCKKPAHLVCVHIRKELQKRFYGCPLMAQFFL